MSRIAFLFPGQGAQRVGMGSQLVEQCPAARELFERAGEVLGYDLLRICREGPASELDSTLYSQPAIFVTSLAALEYLRQQEPDVVLACEAAAGLSLGEYTAMAFAGAMSFEDALRVVQCRAQAMQAAADAAAGGMVSILGLERAQVEELCQQARGQDVLQVANLLCPGNVVVSGAKAACERVAELAEQAGARVVPLAVAGAFHTPMMHPADEHLAEALAQVELRPPQLPVVSNVDARPHEDPEEIRRLLVRQVIQPVLWEDSMRYLLEQGFDTFYEVGPGRVLRGLLRRIDRRVRCTCVEC